MVWGLAAFQKENTPFSLVGVKRHSMGGHYFRQEDQCEPRKARAIPSQSPQSYAWAHFQRPGRLSELPKDTRGLFGIPVSGGSPPDPLPLDSLYRSLTSRRASSKASSGLRGRELWPRMCRALKVLLRSLDFRSSGRVASQACKGRR